MMNAERVCTTARRQSTAALTRVVFRVVLCVCDYCEGGVMIQ